MADLVSCVPRLRRYARALTGDRARADDLVQDTLERALRKWTLWRLGSHLDRWLFSIMHNVFVNQVRSVQGRQAGIELEEVEFELTSPATADEALQQRDLAAALAGLPEDQREVLLLVGLEEMAYKDVARVLDLPLGTVMSRLSRARRHLRALLDGKATTTALRLVQTRLP